MSEHRGPTDETHRITLPSAIELVQWTRPWCAPGGNVGLEIFTTFVANNAEMRIALSDERGNRHGAFADKIYANAFCAQVCVPPEARDALYATVTLPAHGLEQASPPLRLTAPIALTNAQWSRDEARRGDVLTLTADVEGAPDGTPAEIVIFEHDADGAHDLVARFPVLVTQNRVEAQWEFVYHEDTDDLLMEGESEQGYHPPEYFFRAGIGGIFAASPLLVFKDWIEIRISNYDPETMAGAEYLLHLPDGSQRRGLLDDAGRAVEEDVPPGRVRVEFPNADTLLFPE